MASPRHKTMQKLDGTPSQDTPLQNQKELSDMPDEIMFNIFLHLNPKSQAKMAETALLYNSIGHKKQASDNTKRDTLLEQLQGLNDLPDEGGPTLKQLLYHIQTRATPLAQGQQQPEQPVAPAKALIKKLLHVIETSPYTDEEALKLVLRAVYTKPDTAVEGLGTFTPSLSVHPAYLHWVGNLVYRKDLWAEPEINHLTGNQHEINVYIQVSETKERHIGLFTISNNPSLVRHKGWEDTNPTENAKNVANLAKALRAADIEEIYNPRIASAYILWSALTKLPEFALNPEGQHVAVYDLCC